MGKRFFTSDLHLGSTNILKYANRPYNSAQEALTVLTTNVNTSMKKTDILIHVGDFCLHKKDAHDKIIDIGLNYSKDEYLTMFKPRIFLLAGNHDEHNACEPDASSMFIDLNQNYRNIFVSHYPSYHDFYRGPDCSKYHFGHGIVLCGHVHDKWKVMYDIKKNVLNYNVGIDCHNYKPIEDVEITKDLDFIKSAIVKMPKDRMTMDDINLWKKQNKDALEKEKYKRKAERYAKKGITPEIAEQRRIEAMKAKGLIS